MGRLLLSQKSEDTLRKLWADRPDSELASILANRRTDRACEAVVHEGQFESGLCSVAAPVYDLSGSVVAAVSATKMVPRLSGGVVSRVLLSSRVVSFLMGYGG
jgi:DNA-binding IclR family transcriptional regulator